MYESAYNKLFWGMMFIIFNIYLGAINILPNFIGYILIISALDTLVNQHEIYRKGKIPAAILIVITLKDIVNIENANLLNGEFINPWLLAIGTVERLLNLYLMYIICKGIYLLADERFIMELKHSAKDRFKAYLLISVISLFYTPFSLNLSRDINTSMVLIAIINIIINLFLAGLFRKSKELLGGGQIINQI